MLECWFLKEVTHLLASLLREILPISHCPIFAEPIIPLYYQMYSKLRMEAMQGIVNSKNFYAASFAREHHFLYLH